MNDSISIVFIDASGGKHVHTFIGDLTLEEIQSVVSVPLPQSFIDSYALYKSSTTDFKALPNWATWTAIEAESFVSSNIFGGLTQAQVDSQIDALPATIAGMKTGLKQAAAAILSVRSILMAMAKAIVYLRNLVISIRQ